MLNIIGDCSMKITLCETHKTNVVLDGKKRYPYPPLPSPIHLIPTTLVYFSTPAESMTAGCKKEVAFHFLIVTIMCTCVVHGKFALCFAVPSIQMVKQTFRHKYFLSNARCRYVKFNSKISKCLVYQEEYILIHWLTIQHWSSAAFLILLKRSIYVGMHATDHSTIIDLGVNKQLTE